MQVKQKDVLLLAVRTDVKGKKTDLKHLLKKLLILACDNALQTNFILSCLLCTSYFTREKLTHPSNKPLRRYQPLADLQLNAAFMLH